MTYNYLDKSLISEFRNTINSSPVFYSENELKDNWKFMCAIMDRVDRCVDFINDFNIARINSEASLITFLSYCCILNDSISQLFSFTLKDFDEASVKNQSRFFKEDYQRFMNEYDSTCSITSCSDDKFFEFLRSITFAHPLDTDRPKFMKKDDKLCSPRVLVDDLSEVNMQNPIGVDIYSKLDNKTIRFWLSANHIIEFLNSKYNLIHEATKWVNKEIDNYNTKWKKRKVNRNLSTIEMLRDIKEILTERHSDDSFIDETIDLLECRISDGSNLVKVNQYKEALILTLPQVCDWINSMQDDKMYPDNFFALLNPDSKDIYDQEQYELEKIFSNLSDDVVDYKTYIQNKDYYLNKNDSPNIAFYENGLLCAKSFFDNIGNKYLNYNPSNINSAIEVKLLVRTVLFLEKK